VHVSRVGVQGGHGGMQGAQGQPLVLGVVLIGRPRSSD
jgi:hypothetical protein